MRKQANIRCASRKASPEQRRAVDSPLRNAFWCAREAGVRAAEEPLLIDPTKNSQPGFQQAIVLPTSETADGRRYF